MISGSLDSFGDCKFLQKSCASWTFFFVGSSVGKGTFGTLDR